MTGLNEEQEYQDFKLMINGCLFDQDDNDQSIFLLRAKDPNDKVVAEIISRNPKIEMSTLVSLSKKYHPRLEEEKDRETRLINAKKTKFYSMTTQEIADLSFETKADYLAIFFPKELDHYNRVPELIDMVSKKEENFTALVYNIDLPNDFLNSEEEKAKNYFATLKNNPQMAEAIKNYDNLNLEERKQLITQNLKTFCETYNLPIIEAGFYTEEQYKQEHKAKGLKVSNVLGAYTLGKTIQFNEERIMSDDVFFALTVPFHEGIHYYQETNTFEPNIDKMFKSKSSLLSVYDNETKDKTHKNYKNFYCMNPIEKHAFWIQGKVDEMISDEFGVKKEASRDPNAEKIHSQAKVLTDMMDYKRSL